MSLDPRLLEIFLDLVRIDALSGRERPVADRVRAMLEPLGLRLEEDAAAAAVDGDTGNLVCRIDGGGDRILLAHMDTARPTRDLEPEILDDRIVSAGDTILGADNRAGMAAILFLLEGVAAGRVPARPFSVAFTICEETGLEGSRHLAVPEGVELGFVLDSSMAPGRYVRRSYGAQRFRVEMRGRAAHAGIAPEKGVNAVQAMSRGIAGLELGRIDDETTANIGTIAGGSAVNVVPESASAEGEVRSLRRERVEEVIAEFEVALTEAARSLGATAELDSHWDFEPFALERDSSVCREIEAAIARAGLEPEAATTPGGSDANSLNARGLPSVNIGIGARNPHADDEFILLDDLAAAGRIARELVRP